jgi:hypothetical protein
LQKVTRVTAKIAKYLKIDTVICNQLLRLIRNYIIEELRDHGNCYIHGVGNFRFTNNERARLTYSPSETVLNLLTQEAFNPEDVVEKLPQRLGEKYTSKTDFHFFHTLGTPRSPLSITRNFAFYLKNNFPVNKEWVHPETKEIYQAQQVREVVSIFKTINPKGYVDLWLLWTSVDAREYLVKKKCKSTQEVITGWFIAVESLLFILLNPELVPAKLVETLDSPLSKEPKKTYKKKRLDRYLAPFLE